MLPPNNHDFAASTQAGDADVGPGVNEGRGAGLNDTGCGGTARVVAGSSASSAEGSGSFGDASFSGTTGGSTARGGASADRAVGGVVRAVISKRRAATSLSKNSSRHDIRKTIAPSKTSKRNGIRWSPNLHLPVFTEFTGNIRRR